jgi:hypothetical protein
MFRYRRSRAESSALSERFRFPLALVKAIEAQVFPLDTEAHRKHRNARRPVQLEAHRIHVAVS